MYKFISTHSKIYSLILGVSYITHGGEAIVFKVEHTGTDEIVAKSTVFREDIIKD